MNQEKENQLLEWAKSLPLSGPQKLPDGIKERVFLAIQEKIDLKQTRRKTLEFLQPVYMVGLSIILVTLLLTNDLINHQLPTFVQQVQIEPDEAIDVIFDVLNENQETDLSDENLQYNQLILEHGITKLDRNELDHILEQVAKEIEKEWSEI
ncbi:MAG: hypothetical protein N2450_00080 [bacterium]|nr:hypothetical protein [bacterium]